MVNIQIKHAALQFLNQNNFFVKNKCADSLCQVNFYKKIMRYFSNNSVCDKCGLKRTDIKNSILFKHHYELHEDLELPCNYCPKTFPNKRKLKEHERQFASDREAV